MVTSGREAGGFGLGSRVVHANLERLIGWVVLGFACNMCIRAGFKVLALGDNAVFINGYSSDRYGCKCEGEDDLEEMHFSE